MNWMILVANVVACGIAALVVWLASSRIMSRSKRIFLAVGAAIIGFFTYFFVQTLWQVAEPDARIHGHIVVYEIYPFALILVLVVSIIAVILAFRKNPNPVTEIDRMGQ